MKVCKHGIMKIWKNRPHPCSQCYEDTSRAIDRFRADSVDARDGNANSDLANHRTTEFHLGKSR